MSKKTFIVLRTIQGRTKAGEPFVLYPDGQPQEVPADVVKECLAAGLIADPEAKGDEPESQDAS